MSWLRETLDRLASQPCCGYSADAPPATEPTALTAMALAAHGRTASAQPALDWLARIQLPGGSVPIDASHDAPGWATGWAALAWHAAAACKAAADRAVAWILESKGRSLPQSPLLGHDMSLVAWSWAEGTASWVEPTAIQLLALQAEGRADHPRACEAIRLLRDRALPSGGWNCGNTVVLGTPLRANVQSTGLALAALAGHREDVGRISNPSYDAEVRRAIEYLRGTLSSTTTIVSLSYALIGLAAHGQRPEQSDQWLATACTKTLRDGARPYALALAALAALGDPWGVAGDG